VWAGHGKWWSGGWLQGQATFNRTPYGTAPAFFAEAGVRPGRIVVLKASTLSSTRLPTFTELYYGSPGYHPDPNLRPERAITYRLTAMATSLSKQWSGEAAVWYRRTRDVIDWEQRPDPDPAISGDWWSTQLNRLGTFGAEAGVRYSSDRGVLRRASLGYGYIDSEMTVTTGYISKYALDFMRHKVAGMASICFARDWALTLTGSYYDREGAYLVPDPADASKSLQRGYRPYVLVDGRLSWEPALARGGKHLRGVEFYLDGTNLLGADYFDFGGLPMPGTWLSAGVVITIR
jgi:iron complex outermembrane receptor protein